MKDIEDRIQEKYNEVEVPEYMFDTTRVFKRGAKENKIDNKKMISIVASIVIIIIIVSGLIYMIPQVVKDNITEKEESKIKAILYIYDKNARSDLEKIAEIKRIKIIKCMESIIIDEIPYTKIKAEIINSYLGNITGEIEMYVPGGIYTAKEIKENIKEYPINDISKYNDEDIIKLQYNNESYISFPEEGKEYIITIKQVENDYYACTNSKYGFKEYNPNDNTIVINNNVEKFEIDKYIENITK